MLAEDTIWVLTHGQLVGRCSLALSNGPFGPPDASRREVQPRNGWLAWYFRPAVSIGTKHTEHSKGTVAVLSLSLCLNC